MKYILSFLLLIGAIANAGNIIGPTTITSKLSISTGIAISPTIILNGTDGSGSFYSLDTVGNASIGGTIYADTVNIGLGGLITGGGIQVGQPSYINSSLSVADVTVDNALQVLGATTLNDGLTVITLNTDPEDFLAGFTSSAGGSIQMKAGGALTISGSMTAPTFIATALPTSPAGLPSGSIYRSGTNLYIVP